MTELSPESVEGRLIAHRQLLSRVVAILADDPRGRDLLAFLEERSVFQGYEEDPGAVPSPEHAIQLAAAEEFRLVAERAKGSPDAV